MLIYDLHRVLRSTKTSTQTRAVPDKSAARWASEPPPPAEPVWLMEVPRHGTTSIPSASSRCPVRIPHPTLPRGPGCDHHHHKLGRLELLQRAGADPTAGGEWLCRHLLRGHPPRPHLPRDFPAAAPVSAGSRAHTSANPAAAPAWSVEKSSQGAR